MAAQAGVREATREGKGDNFGACVQHMWLKLRSEYGKTSEETQIEKEWETLQQYDVLGSMLVSVIKSEQ